MGFRKEIVVKSTLDGIPVEVSILDGYTIDDLIIGDIKMAAYEKVVGSIGDSPERLPPFEVREALLKTGREG